MSRFDVLKAELLHLRIRQTIAVMVPAVAVVAAVVYETSASRISASSLFTGLVVLLVAPFLFHHAWRVMFGTYRQWSDRSTHIAAEITHLRRRVAAIFEKYRERRKNERFKAAYDLAGKSVRELEEALSVGMYRERREVFMTAFMRAGVAVRVTASIGSPYRCAAADNPPGGASRLNACGVTRYGSITTIPFTTAGRALRPRTSRRRGHLGCCWATTARSCDR